MKNDQARALAEDALGQLANALKDGRSDTLVRYLRTLSRFHTYSFGNALLILVQRPDATRVAGFRTWLKLGRAVRRGEKGIAIFAPMRIRPREESEDAGSASGDGGGGEDRTILRFRVVHVFDVSQTDGDPLPEPASVGGDPGLCMDRLLAFIAAQDIAVDYEDLPLGVQGLSRGGRISLRAGLDPAEAFSVAVHELAHELLHHRGERPESRTVRETEAEAVAFVVCHAVGLDTNTAASDYIQLYQGTTETLAASLDRIQRTAADIIAAVSVEEPAPVPAE